MKVSTMSVDNVEEMLKSDVVATLWQRNANVVTMIKSRNFINDLKTSFSNVVSTSPQLLVWYSLESCLHADNRQ